VSGVYNGAGTAIYLRMDRPNVFRPMGSPNLWRIVDGTGLNVPALTGSATFKVAGSLSVRLCASQAPFLMGWAGTRVNSTRTSPWSTDQLPNDLASCTLDFGWSKADLSMKRQRSLGVKVAKATLRSQASETDPFVYLDLDLIGMVLQGNAIDGSQDPTADAFPEPTQSQLASDYFYHNHSRQGLFIGGETPRSQYERTALTITNKVKAYFDEDHFANRVRCNGRVVQLMSRNLLNPTPDDRATFEAVNNLGACALTYDNGTNSMTVNLNGQNYIDSVGEDLVLDDDNYYDLNFTAHLDPNATPVSDMSLSFA
jgi:hypothetical protein